VWDEYQRCGYASQQLFRDDKWKERGVDPTIIGHMWRLVYHKEWTAVEARNGLTLNL
jgi:hypothetical protein